MPAKNIERQPPDEAVAFLPTHEPIQAVETQRLRGVAKIAGAKVEYTLEQPTDEAVVVDSVPIVLVHGFGGVKTSYRQLRTSLAQMGKPAITYRPARSRGIRGDMSPLNLLYPNKLASQAAWAVMRDIRADIGHELFDVSGHSMGGQTVANLASHKHEHIRSAIFVASVGLGNHSLPHMLGRAARFLPQELAPSAKHIIESTEPRVALESLHYWLRNPQRSLAEGLGTAGCNLHERLVEMEKSGIKTAAIQFQNDVFFPLEAAIKHSRHLFHAHHVYEDPGSNHLTPQLDPQGVAGAIISVLGRLYAQAEYPASDLEAAA